MNFTAEEIEEFKTEAIELLDIAETELLALESDGNFQTHYNAIFRVFHSLKGGAGMLGLTQLQDHMHALETLFSKLKSETKADKASGSFFLKGVDAARRILAGEAVQFDYNFKTESTPSTPSKDSASARSNRSSTPSGSSTTSPVTQSPTQAHSESVVYAIDDEPEVLEVIRDTLTPSGIQCQCFDDPTKLLSAIQSKPPSAVLVDMKMPIMDGMQILREIRAIDAELPVLFVSGYLETKTLLESMDHGLFGALEKPFSSKELIGHVVNAIRFRQVSILLGRSVNLLLYQFSDLDKFLQQHGKEDIRQTIRTEMEKIIETRKYLKQTLRGMRK